MSRKAFIWTPDAIDIAVVAWNLGRSAAQVAKMIGVSDSAVIGKMDRLRKKGIVLRERLSDPGMKPLPVSKPKHIPPARRNTYYKDTGIILNTVWPVSKIDTLVEKWKAGGTETSIAEQMGVTKSSAKGKIAQLIAWGIVQRKSDNPNFVPANAYKPFVKPDPVRQANYQAGNLRKLAKFEAQMSGDGVGILELKLYSCRWPVAGTGEHMRYCGEPKVVGSYCECHAARAFNGLSSPKKQVGA